MREWEGGEERGGRGGRGGPVPECVGDVEGLKAAQGFPVFRDGVAVADAELKVVNDVLAWAERDYACGCVFNASRVRLLELRRVSEYSETRGSLVRAHFLAVEVRDCETRGLVPRVVRYPCGDVGDSEGSFSTRGIMDDGIGRVTDPW